VWIYYTKSPNKNKNKRKVKKVKVMLRKLVKKAIMPKQERESTYQYFKRVDYTEKKIKDAIATAILTLTVTGFYSWLFLAWLIYG
jgi:hypothetical protein